MQHSVWAPLGANSTLHATNHPSLAMDAAQGYAEPMHPWHRGRGAPHTSPVYYRGGAQVGACRCKWCGAMGGHKRPTMGPGGPMGCA